MSWQRLPVEVKELVVAFAPEFDRKTRKLQEELGIDVERKGSDQPLVPGGWPHGSVIHCLSLVSKELLELARPYRFPVLNLSKVPAINLDRFLLGVNQNIPSIRVLIRLYRLTSVTSTLNAQDCLEILRLNPTVQWALAGVRIKNWTFESTPPDSIAKFIGLAPSSPSLVREFAIRYPNVLDQDGRPHAAREHGGDYLAGYHPALAAAFASCTSLETLHISAINNDNGGHGHPVIHPPPT
ncbi:hypothetical protein JCM8547_008881 [Rhodosporidiobolus lusitaniae]